MLKNDMMHNLLMMLMLPMQVMAMVDYDAVDDDDDDDDDDDNNDGASGFCHQLQSPAFNPKDLIVRSYMRGFRE